MEYGIKFQSVFFLWFFYSLIITVLNSLWSMLPSKQPKENVSILKRCYSPVVLILQSHPPRLRGSAWKRSSFYFQYQHIPCICRAHQNEHTKKKRIFRMALPHSFRGICSFVGGMLFVFAIANFKP